MFRAPRQRHSRFPGSANLDAERFLRVDFDKCKIQITFFMIDGGVQNDPED